MPVTVFSHTDFAVLAVAEPEHQRVFADIAGQAIAAPLLDEPDQLGIVAEGLFEKLEPARAIGGLGRRDRGDLGDSVCGIRLAKFARAQIDGAGRRAEQERIAIPYLGSDGHLAVGLCELLDAAGKGDLANLLQFALAGQSSVNSRASSRQNWNASAVSSFFQCVPVHSNHAPVWWQ